MTTISQKRSRHHDVFNERDIGISGADRGSLCSRAVRILFPWDVRHLMWAVQSHARVKK